MLKGPPTTAHLSRLYEELERIGASCVGAHRSWPYGRPDRIELLTLAAEMLRHDPRLLTILVRYCLGHFRDINPSAIRGRYGQMETPQAWAVIAEFVKAAAQDREAIYWAEHIQRGLAPVPLQLFYHHIYAPGGHMAQRAVEMGLAEYRRWGFLACERPTRDEGDKSAVGSLDRSARINILNRLLAERGQIRLSDYTSAIGGCVSRQQALADMKSISHLARKGRGRGARWSLVA